MRQVEQLVAAGVAQELAARVVGCSRRSVSRVLARRAERDRELTLEEILASVPTLEEVLATPLPRPRRPPRRQPSWMAAAARADALEAERLDDPAA